MSGISLSYDIAVEHNKENSPPPPVSDVETLVLSHFSHPPRLDFGSVKAKQMKRCQLNFRNPNDAELDVKIEKFPHKKGFRVETLDFVVDGTSTYPLYIDWIPDEPGSFREMVLCHVGDAFRVQAYLLGKCPEPPKPKKTVGKTIKSLRKPVNTIGRPSNKSTVRSSTVPKGDNNEKKSGKPGPPVAVASVQKTSSRAPLQPRMPNRENIGGSKQQIPQNPSKKKTCNDHILSQPIKANELDPRMTMRLSKPTVLVPSAAGNYDVHSKVEDEEEDMHLLETYVEHCTVTTEEVVVYDVQTEVYSEGNQPTDLRAGKNIRPLKVNEMKIKAKNLPQMSPMLAGARHRETYVATTDELTSKSQHKSGSRPGGTWTMGGIPAGATNGSSSSASHRTFKCLDDGGNSEEVYNVEEIVEECVEEYVEEVETENRVEEYVQRDCGVMSETIVLSTGLNETNVVNSYQSSSTTVSSVQTDVASTKTYNNNISTTVTAPRSHLVPDDPNFPDTPTRRVTFIKDDPHLPDTPSRRVTFKKNDPDLPSTPIRRDTYLKLESLLSNTPVILSPDSLNDSPSLTPQRDRRMRMGVSSLTPKARKDTRSVSPPRERHSLKFNDDTQIHKLAEESVSLEVDLVGSSHTPLSRYGTYTKLNGSISPRPNVESSMLDHSPATTYSVIDDLEDFEIPCPVENPQSGCVSKSKRDKHKKLSIISERSEKSERRSILSTDSLDDQRIEEGEEDGFIISGRSSPTGSKYATAYTTPYESPSMSDEENECFEDSVAYLLEESPTVNTTVRENSQLMASILRDKLERVASFDGMPGDITGECATTPLSSLKNSHFKGVGVNDSITSLISVPQIAPVPEFDGTPGNMTGGSLTTPLSSQKNSCLKDAGVNDSITSLMFLPQIAPVPEFTEEEEGGDLQMGEESEEEEEVVSVGVEKGEPSQNEDCIDSDNNREDRVNEQREQVCDQSLGPSRNRQNEALHDSFSFLKTPGFKGLPPVPVFEDQTPLIEEDNSVRRKTLQFNNPRHSTTFVARSPSMYGNPFNDTGLEVSTLGFENETFLKREKMNLKDYGPEPWRKPTESRGKNKMVEDLGWKDSLNGKEFDGEKRCSRSRGRNRTEVIAVDQAEEEGDNDFIDTIGLLKTPQTKVQREISQRCSSTPCNKESAGALGHYNTENLSKTPSPIIGSRVSRDTVTKSRASAALVNAEVKTGPTRQAKKGLVYGEKMTKMTLDSGDRGDDGVRADIVGPELPNIMEEFMRTVKEEKLSEMLDCVSEEVIEARRFSTLTVTKSKPSLSVRQDSDCMYEQRRGAEKLSNRRLFKGLQASDAGATETELPDVVVENNDNTNAGVKGCKWKQHTGDMTYKVEETCSDEGGGFAVDVKPVTSEVNVFDIKMTGKKKGDNVLEADQNKGRPCWYKGRMGTKSRNTRERIIPQTARPTTEVSRTIKSNPDRGSGRSRVTDEMSCAIEVSPQKRDHSQDKVGVRKRFRSEQMARPNSQTGNSRLSVSAIANNKRPIKPPSLRKQATLSNMSKSVSKTVVNAKKQVGTGRVAVKTKLTLIRQPKACNNQALPKHPLAFAAKNVYYDERWMEKEEKGFVKWLNFILTPPDFYFDARKPKKIDAGQLFITENQYSLTKAPTKEVLSFNAYSVRRKFNRLRRDACRLFQTELFVTVQNKLEREINCKRLAIRTDRLLFADLGLKQKILEMLLSYNPLWLRIGLETIYGEVVHTQSTTDVLGLSQFIAHRFLGNPDISAEYAHPTVPHLYRDGYYESLGQFTLKKYLILVMFLDHAKRSRLILEDPCLFCKDSEFKSSKDLLLHFSRDFLAGEGDLVKHLTYMGYKVSHQQTPLEEVDYAVSTLATDLRDGIRITRVVSLLTEDWGLLSSLRCPAISILQKVHNVGVALRALIERKVDLQTARGGKINARDIVDGHREKTLQLLWRIIFNFQVEQVIDKTKLQQEVTFLKCSLSTKKLQDALLCDLDPDALGLPREARDSVDPSDIYYKSDKLYLLLRWCRAVCAHYNVKVENFTVSFSDGRVLCFLLHYYHPELLPRQLIHADTTQTYLSEGDSSIMSDDSFADSCMLSYADVKSPMYGQLLKNEKENFKTLYEKVTELGGVPLMLRASDMSATIPDEKVVITYVSYLCARLLDIRLECQAARVIQHAWRKYRVGKYRGSLKERHEAARIIQHTVKPFLERRKKQKMSGAAAVLQRCYRGYIARNLLKSLKEEAELKRLSKMAVTVQACMRGYLTRRRLRDEHLKASVVQSVYRGWRDRRAYRRLRRAVVCVQNRWRANRLCRAEIDKLVAVKTAAIQLQYRIKKWLRVRRLVQHQAASRIQAFFRMVHTKQQFAVQRASVVVLQSCVRTWLAGRRYKNLSSAVRVIQSKYRALCEGRREHERYTQLRGACLCLQSYSRGFLVRRHVMRLKAAVQIQAAVRGHIQRSRYTVLRRAVVVIQRRYRAVIQRRETMEEYRRTKRCIVGVQACVRGYLVRQRMKRSSLAVVVLQKYCRGYVLRCRLKREKEAAKKIQGYFRGYLIMKRERKGYKACIQATVALQSWFRMLHVKKEYLHVRELVVRMQALSRKNRALKRYHRLKNVAVVIQRRYRACRLSKVVREEFIHTRQTVIKLQSSFRMFHARKEFLRVREFVVRMQALLRRNRALKQYDLLKKASLVIQRRYRACRLSKVVREEFMQTKQTVVKVQSWFRMFRARKKYLHLRELVIRMQALSRRKKALKQYKSIKNASLVIQRRYRACRLGKVDRQEFIHIRQAVIKIQSWFRMFRARKEYLYLRELVVKMQALSRRNKALKQYDRLKKASLVIQRQYRACRLSKVARQEFTQTRQAVIKIQSCVRMWKGRARFSQTKAVVVKLQSLVRGKLAKERYLKTRQAIETIQRYYRGYVAMRSQRHSYMCLRESVIRLQSMVRMKTNKLKYLKQIKAIVHIQSLIRAKQESVRFARKKSAAMCIQRAWRAHYIGMVNEQIDSRVRNAAVSIQAVVRGYLIRKRLQRMKQGIVKLQSLVRSRLQQRQFIKYKYAAGVLHSWWRATLEARRHRENFLTLKQGIVRCQSCYRARRVEREYLSMRRGFTKLQAVCRMRRQRREYGKVKSSVDVLQRRLKATLQARVQRTMYLHYRRCTTVLQAAVRGYCQRTQYHAMRSGFIRLQAQCRMRTEQKKYEQVKWAVHVLQQRWRASRQMDACRQEFEIVRCAAVRIQAGFRGLREKRRYEAVRAGVIRLQALVRGVLQRKALLRLRAAVIVTQYRIRTVLLARRQRAQYLAMREAAINIQSCYRCVVARRTYQTMKVGFTSLQALYRTRIARRNFELTKEAVTKIQQWWRGMLLTSEAERQYTVLRGAVIIVQSVIRGYLCKKRYRAVIQGVTKLQALHRCRVGRKEFLSCHSAALVIQRRWRATCIANQQRARYLHSRAAVVRLQSVVRGYRQRKEYLSQRESVMKLQAFWRCALQRRKYVNAKRAVRCIQERWRAIVVCRESQMCYHRQLTAIRCIQSWYRRVQHSRFIARSRAAVRLQACWRGHRQRIAYRQALAQSALRKQAATVILQHHIWRYILRKRALGVLRHKVSCIVRLQALGRGFLVRRKLRRLNAVVCLQAAVRGFLVKKRAAKTASQVVKCQGMVRMWRCRWRFTRLRHAALTLQRHWRACMLGRSVREELQVFHQKTTVIQSSYRRYRAQKLYIQMRTGFVKLQRLAKRFLYRKHYERVYRAAVTIQRWWGSVQEVRVVRAEYVRKMRSTMVIQRHLRRYIERRRGLREAIVKVQAAWRGYLLRARLKTLTTVVIAIQRKFRKCREKLLEQRRARAVVKIQSVMRGYLVRRNYLRFHRAVLMAQSLWRGRKVRLSVQDARINKARVRVQKATNKATEDRSLASRTISALDFLLKCKNLGTILGALIDLDVVTKLLPECCERLVEANAVHVLYKVILGANRSVPHQELIRYAVSTLLNLAKYDKTADAVYNGVDSINLLVDMMSIYRDKKCMLFPQLCTLLGIIGHNPQVQQDVQEIPRFSEKLRSIQTLVARKHKMEANRQKAAARMAAMKSFNCTLPLLGPALKKRARVKPEWVLKKGIMSHIKDPLEAIEFVLETFSVSPK